MSYIRVLQHEPRSLRWWHQQHVAGKLDLAPAYQRRSAIWSRFKRAHLIDSILNDFDIPKLYVADFTVARSALNQQNKPYAIVDGKQRFEAVFGFLAGEFALNASSLYEADLSCVVKNLTFSQLEQQHPSLALKIETYEPTVMSIATDDDGKIYEMFVRLNSGEAANSAEKRNAKSGLLPPLIRELAAHPFFSNRVRFNRKRMAEFNLAAKLMLIEYKGGFVDTKASYLDRFVEGAAKEVGDILPPSPSEPLKVAAYKEYQAVFDSVIENLESLAEAFKPSDPLLSAAGHIPVYYWMIRKYPELVDNFRDFLENFNDRVLKTMRNAKEGSGHVEPTLMTYYTHGRTTNDQQSLIGRFKIMEGYLKRAHLI